MVQLLFRSSMNILTETNVLPKSHKHNLNKVPHSPIFIDASPIAVSNKIRAIQARKTRHTLVRTDREYTDIRPLNFSYAGGVASSKMNFSFLTNERLNEQTKDLRTVRISHQPSRPLALSATSTNYQSSIKHNKQNRIQSNLTTSTPSNNNKPIKNKSTGGKIPSIPQDNIRKSLVDRQNSLMPIGIKYVSVPKKSSSHIQLANITSRTNNNHDDPRIILKDKYHDKQNENIDIDEEFQEYFNKAIVKCADWLMKYVFNEKNNENK